MPVAELQMQYGLTVRPVEGVRDRYELRPGSTVGVVRIGSLEHGTAEQLHQVLTGLKADQTRGLILELARDLGLGGDETDMPIGALVRFEAWAKWMDRLPVTPDTAAAVNGMSCITPRAPAGLTTLGWKADSLRMMARTSAR